MQNSPRPAVLALTLVLALSVVAFGAMVRGAIAQGDVAASWHIVGADATIDTTNSAESLTWQCSERSGGHPRDAAGHTSAFTSLSTAVPVNSHWMPLLGTTADLLATATVAAQTGPRSRSAAS